MLVAVLTVVGWLVRDQLRLADKLGSQPSFQADGASELAALASGMHYYKRGFIENFGLPDLSTPPQKWYVDPNDEPASNGGCYTHYPPGPNWLVGAGIHLCGPNNFACYRRIPIFFGGLCLILSFLCMTRTVGSVAAAAFIGALAAIPMTSEMMHGLHYQGYALSLIILQMSYSWYLFSLSRTPRTRELTAMFGLSFIQGWLSFDYFFISSLFPVSIYFLGSKRSLLDLGKQLFASLGAFVCAIALHFIQNALYSSTGHRASTWRFEYHSLVLGFEGAFNDLFMAAKYRSGSIQPRPNSSFFEVTQRYTGELLPSASQGGDVGMLLIAAAVTLAVLTLIVSYARSKRSGSVGPRGSLIMAPILGYLLSMLWPIVMRDHALDGTHMTFVPRHFIVLLYAATGVVAVVLSDLFSWVGALVCKWRPSCCEVSSPACSPEKGVCS